MSSSDPSSAAGLAVAWFTIGGWTAAVVLALVHWRHAFNRWMLRHDEADEANEAGDRWSEFDERRPWHQYREHLDAIDVASTCAEDDR